MPSLASSGLHAISDLPEHIHRDMIETAVMDSDTQYVKPEVTVENLLLCLARIYERSPSQTDNELVLIEKLLTFIQGLAHLYPDRFGLDKVINRDTMALLRNFESSESWIEYTAYIIDCIHITDIPSSAVRNILSEFVTFKGASPAFPMDEYITNACQTRRVPREAITNELQAFTSHIRRLQAAHPNIKTNRIIVLCGNRVIFDLNR